MSKERHEETVNTKVMPAYVQSILKSITPQYFQEETKKNSEWSPSQAIALSNYSRIFDKLASETSIPDDVIETFVNNALSYGYEYASGVAINPLIEAIVDVQAQKLTETFITQNIGDYQVLINAFKDKIKSDLRTSIIEEYRNRQLESLIKTNINISQKELNDQLDEYIKTPDISQIIESDVQNAFNKKFQTEDAFQKHADSKIAHGFIDACTILFMSAIYKPKEHNEKTDIISFLVTNRGQYDQVRNAECDETLKLYDIKNKFLICPQLTEDINQLASKYTESTIFLSTDDETLNRLSNINNSDFRFITLIQLNDLLNSKIKAQKNSKKGELDQKEIVSKIDALLEKYNLNLVKEALEKLQTPNLSNEEKTKYTLVIKNFNQIIQKNNQDYIQSQNQFYYSLIVAAITLIIVATVVTLSLFTFGAGAALIPFIPAMIAMALSAITGISLTSFFALKSRDHAQKFAIYEQEILKTPNQQLGQESHVNLKPESSSIIGNISYTSLINPRLKNIKPIFSSNSNDQKSETDNNADNSHKIDGPRGR